jgi:hypothetical protein
LIQGKVPPGDEAAARKYLQDQLEILHKQNKNAPHFQLYLKYSADDRKKIETDAANLWEKVYLMNKPVSHNVEVRPLATIP